MDRGAQVDAPAPADVAPLGHPTRMPWLRRRWPWVVLALLLAVAVAAVTWGSALLPGRPVLVGAVLKPPVFAYDFSLPDQDGRIVSLSSFRGKVVALTFLYSHCPDVCPLIAERLHQTYQQLGQTAGRVAFVAVSVDPNGDTPEAVRTFLAAHHVEREMTYLRGSFAQLRPVWAHYYVGSDAAEVNPEATAAAKPTAGQVGHTAIVYLIDPEGKLTAFLPGNLDAADLVTDLRLLASGAQP